MPLKNFKPPPKHHLSLAKSKLSPSLLSLTEPPSALFLSLKSKSPQPLLSITAGKIFKHSPSLAFPLFAKSKFSSLSPFVSLYTTTAHQHLHGSIFSLSTPNLDSRCLASPSDIEIHCRSRRKTPKAVSFSLFPTTNTRSFLCF